MASSAPTVVVSSKSSMSKLALTSPVSHWPFESLVESWTTTRSTTGSVSAVWFIRRGR